jgi:thiamine-phosphate pyrophosphorylase
VAEGAIDGGLELLLLRETALEERALIDLLRRLGPLLGEGLILHGSSQDAIALAVRCGTGLHLPARTDAAPLRPMIKGWLGQSCHDPLELATSRAAGCDYVTLSPVFQPISKPADTRRCLGTEGLAQLCVYTDIPVLALGGITPERVPACISAGAYGVASMGGIFAPECTPEEARSETRDLIESLKNRTISRPGGSA